MEYTMTDSIEETGLNQTDYLKLFMQQLTYQDPLQPVDNREFMAQMAQFSSLQEARATNENLVQLLAMNSGSQCLQLLGKKIKLVNGTEGIVINVQFADQKPPSIVVKTDSGRVPGIELKQIIEVEDELA
jgi:flagellar basal-body rod modification protein FlgD